MRPLLLLLLATAPSLFAQGWYQWGAGPAHPGSLAVGGQRLDHKVADVVYDPFVELERAEAHGVLYVHYQTPLTDGDDVFMEVKGGRYTSFTTWETQSWGIRKFSWIRGELVPRWTAWSDWTPVPDGASRFEPVFHAALANGRLYMPAGSGLVAQVDRETGAITRYLGMNAPDPMPTVDPDLFVISPISADAAGNLFFNTLRIAEANPWGIDHRGAWLVKVTPEGVASAVAYQTLVPEAPAPADRCLNQFPSSQLPWPPSPGAVPPSIVCGSQRAGLNIAPAIAPDGTVYTVSRTHLASRWAWLVAVNGSDLTPKWAASLRNRFADGCNVLLPPNGEPGGCRAGATPGVDPADNQPGSGIVNDNSTASPVIAPDGSVFYGAYSRYNFAQGHLMKFSSSGEYLGAYPFGWDITPALWSRGDGYSLITKENRYAEVGSYCSDETWCPEARMPGDPEGYYITQLDPALGVEWKYRSSNTMSCQPRPDGSLECVDDHPEGFEWCVNAPAVDANGVVYANSEDGNLYAIRQGGVVRDHIFLQLALGAAYTPLSLGSDGRIYTQNAGHLFVVAGSQLKRRAAPH